MASYFMGGLSQIGLGFLEWIFVIIGLILFVGFQSEKTQSRTENKAENKAEDKAEDKVANNKDENNKPDEH